MGSYLYKKAFEFDLSHDFYEVAQKYDIHRYLEIVPSEPCVQLMKRGRMRMVRTQKGFSMFYEAYLDTVPVVPEEKPLVELSGPLEFVFTARVKEAQNFIQNVSDFNIYSGLTLQKQYGGGMKYFLKGTGAVPAMTASLIDQVRPKAFTYTFRGREVVTPFAIYTGLVDITVKDEANNVVFSFSDIASDPANGVYTLPLNFSGESNGQYTITAVKDGTSNIVHEGVLYVDPALSREEFMIMIRMRYADASDLYDTAENFTYAIPSRKIRWRYFISVKEYPLNFFDDNYLQVNDTGSTYTFTPETPPGIPHPSFKVNGLDTIVITATGGGPLTNGKIPFTQAAIETFRLQQLGDVTKTLFDSLPNGTRTGTDSNNLNSPSVDLPPYAEIFLTVDKLTTS